MTGAQEKANPEDGFNLFEALKAIRDCPELHVSGDSFHLVVRTRSGPHRLEVHADGNYEIHLDTDAETASLTADGGVRIEITGNAPSDAAAANHQPESTTTSKGRTTTSAKTRAASPAA